MDRGWHQIVVTVDNGERKSTLFVNGAKIDEIQVRVGKNVKYVGNSKQGSNSIGCILDLRIYSHLTSPNFVQDNFTLDDDIYKYEFPDNLLDLIRVKDGINKMFNALQSDYYETQIQIFKCLIAMTTKRTYSFYYSF